VVADGVFNHSFIRRDDEGCLLHEEEEADSLQGLNGCVGQAAIEVVDQDNKLLQPGLSKQFVEVSGECLDRLNHRFFGTIFEVIGNAANRLLEIGTLDARCGISSPSAKLAYSVLKLPRCRHSSEIV